MGSMEPERAAQLGPFAAPQIGDAQRRFWLIVDAMIAALVVITLVGGWAYVQVRGSLRDVRAAGLASLLEVEARTLQLWIDEKRRDAERWAATPQVRREGAWLAGLAAPCDAGSQRGFRDALAPYMALEEVAVFNLIGGDGRILSSQRPGLCGTRVTEGFLRELAPVLQGHTAFVPPLTETDGVALRGPAGEPLVWIEAPIRAADGTVVAALGFGRVAAERFGRLLALTTGGTTRDAYAFDASARMVTEPRHAAGLAAAAPRDGPIALRDPGGDVLAGHRPGAPEASRPLTALAEAALVRRESSEGVLIEPYRNYRGARVIGAWRWLPGERLGVAVELDAEEAYGPLEYLQLAFGVLFALVLVSMTAAASTSLWALRSRLSEAKRVGAYRIERAIGEGGMSDVYLARHAYLKRLAAVKVLKPHLATDEAVTRFKREAQLCSQLSHPHTVEVFDYGTTREGRWYYAMEYLDGIALEDLVKRHGRLPVGRALHALRQACGSLAEAHARGWVHRDVKPNNIMLCVRGGQYDFVKVVDFGLIKQLAAPQTRDITQYSKILGTPLYMAPERLRNPADADARADIYALGAVAYFILSGRSAFAADTEHDAIYKVLNEPAPALAAAGAVDVPPQLAALVARCLEKPREARPATIEEVDAILEAVARDFPWTQDDARAWWAEHPEERAAPVAVS
jgi:tRNA A-37 threonylcarbamoyl transferase component Bud32